MVVGDGHLRHSADSVATGHLVLPTLFGAEFDHSEIWWPPFDKCCDALSIFGSSHGDIE
jgi:hypothetical protein